MTSDRVRLRSATPRTVRPPLALAEATTASRMLRSWALRCCPRGSRCLARNIEPWCSRHCGHSLPVQESLSEFILVVAQVHVVRVHFEADGLTCRFVKPPRGFTVPAAHETDGVTSVDRLGMEVRVTTLARTVADLFDRHDLAGGAEELFNSLDLVARIDAGALVRHARARGNAAAAGAMGFWLERERERLGVPREALEDLRALAPSRPRYALGATPGSARTARGWNVIVPVDVAERGFEGL